MKVELGGGENINDYLRREDDLLTAGYMRKGAHQITMSWIILANGERVPLGEQEGSRGLLQRVRGVTSFRQAGGGCSGRQGLGEVMGKVIGWTPRAVRCLGEGKHCCSLLIPPWLAICLPASVTYMAAQPSAASMPCRAAALLQPPVPNFEQWRQWRVIRLRGTDICLCGDAFSERTT